jgi:hypothetical protein
MKKLDRLRVRALPLRLQRRLLGAEVNADGVLIANDLGRFYATRAGQRFARLPPGPDVRIQLAKMAPGVRVRLAGADTNGAFPPVRWLRWHMAVEVCNVGVDHLVAARGKKDRYSRSGTGVSQAWGAELVATAIAPADGRKPMTSLRFGLHSLLPSVACVLAVAGCSGSPAPSESGSGGTAATARAPSTTQEVVQPRMEDDGTIRVTALPARLQGRLLAADANDDGVLVSDELGRYYAARNRQRFERLGPSPDGKVELAALAAGVRARLAPADTNTDGAVSRHEFMAFQNARWRTRLRRADGNGDGLLTKDELGPVRWVRLAVADKDGDGQLTFAEIDEKFAWVGRRAGAAPGEER